MNISGGQASNLIQVGNLYTFDLTPSTYPSRISIGLGEGAVSSGFSESIAVSQSFTQSQSLVNDESLALWYTFDELNGSIIRDLSGNDVHGEINAGILVPGKFASSLLLDPGEHLSVDNERLSLTTDFTLSLWAKILDDGHGVLVRMGCFHCNTMKIIPFAGGCILIAGGETLHHDFQVADGFIMFYPTMVQASACMLMALLFQKFHIADICLGLMGMTIIYT